MIGTVKWFNDSKGYGFISTETHADVFAHWQAITHDGFKTLCEEQVVEFDLVAGPNGPQATNIRKITGEQSNG